MKITPEISEKIQNAISDFVANYEHFLVEDNKTSEKLDLRKIAAEINVLPLCFDWTACWGIQADGSIISFTFEKISQVEIEKNQKIINMVLFKAAKDYADLKELMPVRNDESIVCPGCDGTGIIKEFADHEILSKSVVCNCGGVGWLPNADQKYLYF